MTVSKMTELSPTASDAPSTARVGRALPGGSRSAAPAGQRAELPRPWRRIGQAEGDGAAAAPPRPRQSGGTKKERAAPAGMLFAGAGSGATRN